jgi:hypothetical protein
MAILLEIPIFGFISEKMMVIAILVNALNGHLKLNFG